MGNTRINREIVKAAGLGMGAVALLGGAAIGGTLLFNKMEQQVVQGLQEAAYPAPQPTMIGHAEVFRETTNHTGPTPGDYVVPGTVLVADIGVAAYALWRFREKRQPQLQARPLESAASSSRLTPQEAQAFEMIVSHFDQDS